MTVSSLSLSKRLYALLALAIIPLSIVIGIQLIDSRSQAQTLDHSYRTYDLANLQAQQFKDFLNAAADSVDTGTLAPRALDSLNAAIKSNQELAHLKGTAHAQPALVQIRDAITKDASLSTMILIKSQTEKVEATNNQVLKTTKTELNSLVANSLSSNARQAWIVALTALGSAVLALVMGSRIIRSVTLPLKAAIEWANRISNGQLGVAATMKAEGEVGSLMGALSRMDKSLVQIIESVKTAAKTISDDSERLAQGAGATSSRAQEQSDKLIAVSAALDEITTSVFTIRDNAKTAADSAERTRQVVAHVAKLAQDNSKKTDAVVQQVGSSSQSIESLSNAIENIGEVTAVINEIANQTNLLALNAAIEAARAGEQGRGFAVVADEVRRLAEKTSSSTANIADHIGGIRSRTAQSVLAMTAVSEGVSSGAQLYGEIESVLHEIMVASDNVYEMASHIASSTLEHSDSTDQITHHINDASHMATETSHSIQEVDQISRQMVSAARGLIALTEQFRIA